MSRPIKEKIVKQYAARFDGVSDAIVVSTQGIGVQRMTALRRSLRAKGIRAMVVHNRLCRVALKATGLEAAGGLLRGPSTLTWGGATIVDVAKALSAEAKTLTELEVRGGVSGGRVLSKEDVEALARLPAREELLGGIVARATGPGRRVAALVTAMGGRLAAQVREVEKRAPAPAASEAPAAPEAAAPPPAPEVQAAPPAPAEGGAPAGA